MPRAEQGAHDEPLIWLRPERASRQPRAERPALDRAAITRAAISLADEHGLDAVSMRRVAEQLGAGAMSLYWYVSSKEDLYELMFDEVVGEIRLPRKWSGDWRADLAKSARATRRILRRHPWVMLIGVQPGLGPKTQAWGQAYLSVFADHDLDMRTRVNILAAINNYIFGFVHREVAWEQLRQRSGRTSDEWTKRLADYSRDVAVSEPDVADEITSRFELHGDASFEFGLTCMLDGIAAHLER